jgi:glycosyltransferase involved in cell wall biosynthesis
LTGRHGGRPSTQDVYRTVKYVRVAYVTESFPPAVNGVAHTAVRVAEHLLARGHEPLVIAPEPASGEARPDAGLGFPVVRVPSLPLAGLYPGFRVGLPGRHVHEAVARHRADLVHLAGPFVLGASGCAAARRLGLPSVAVSATDLPAYARSYHTGPAGQRICWRLLRRIHNAADRTLAPCRETAAELDAHGVQRVWLWARGVDSNRFDPAKRDPALRARLAPDGQLLAGYVGRLAAASGLPVVAPAAGGPADLVHDGVTGFLVAPGDAAALAAGVARLAADPALRAAQSAAARRAMAGRTWPALCDELIGHYLVPALVAMAWDEYRSGAGDGGEGGLAVDPLAAAQPPVAKEA